MDKGMKHVGTISKPGGLRTGIKRVFYMNSHTTNAYPITKEVHDYLLPVYERGRLVENDWEYNEIRERCKYL